MTGDFVADGPALTGFRVRASAPEVSPAPIARDWMSATRSGWANRCLPMLMANQSGWVLRNACAVSAVWTGEEGPSGVSVIADPSDAEELVPTSHFGYGILTWHIPIVFRTPPGYDLLVRGPANWPKDGLYALEGLIETDWASASFTMNWKFTRPMTPVRFALGEPICMIVPQRRGELEEFTPCIRPIESEPQVEREYRTWNSARTAFMQATRETAPSDRLRWQGDYLRGRHVDGATTQVDHRTRRRLRPFTDTDLEQP
ncbi:DUF6065 family protein [Nocardia beijingensis]|uniref:DUF6065 family protein n=1 Tax=Nocardia beijingensis TaxID=95162 RepID=UPI00082D74DD|nr:DUF6065 family protein [Nocardia beijingensis]